MNQKPEIDRTLEWFDYGENWFKGSLSDNVGSKGCLVGGLILANELLDYRDITSDEDWLNLYLPCTTTIAEVIREQYPDRLRANSACLCNQCQKTDDDLSITDIIFVFNDHNDTVYSDIRTVLEKAAIIEQEKE